MIRLKELAFTKDKGIQVKFAFMHLDCGVSGDAQFSAHDLKPDEKMWLNLQIVRDGLDKVMYGPKEAAARKRRAVADSVEIPDGMGMVIEKIAFGTDETGDFAVFTLQAGLKDFDSVGVLKLPKAYYTLDEKNYSLFPCEDQPELQLVKAEAEEMIRAYLQKLGALCEGSSTTLQLMYMGEQC